MSGVIISIFSMYLFIILGFSAKKIFTQEIEAKTLNILSIYFFQPFLTFWGLTQRPLDFTLFMAPLWYFVIVVSVLIVAFWVARMVFADPKERSIATVAALIGNTGNLGIPMGIALFGIESVPFMTLINLVNVFIVYTFGVYFYARGTFNMKHSVLKIFKLPILWFALLAIVANLYDVTFHASIVQMLHMGAYASMVVQLVLFGVYLAQSHIASIPPKLAFWVLGMKFAIVPLVALGVLYFSTIDAKIAAMIFMELIMPLAVANINLASLYACNVVHVTQLVFLSSLLFLLLLFAYIPFISGYFSL